MHHTRDHTVIDSPHQAHSPASEFLGQPYRSAGLRSSCGSDVAQSHGRAQWANNNNNLPFSLDHDEPHMDASNSRAAIAHQGRYVHMHFTGMQQSWIKESQPYSSPQSYRVQHHSFCANTGLAAVATAERLGPSSWGVRFRNSISKNRHIGI